MSDGQQVKVYRPFPSEVPADLVGADAEVDDVRVAKLDGVVIGAYWLARIDAHRFEIKALAVYGRHRGQGVGRWLLGHALGIIESRGGRIVDAPHCAAGLFRKAGFEPVRAEGAEDRRLRLHLTPE